MGFINNEHKPRCKLRLGDRLFVPDVRITYPQRFTIQESRRRNARQSNGSVCNVPGCTFSRNIPVFIPRGDHILVVDSSGKQLADVGKAHDTHAIAFAPELKTAYLSAQDSVDVLDLEKMQVVQRIDLSGKDPDAILYDASSKRVFTFNGGGTKDTSAIDTGTGRVVGSIPLGGKPEFAQADGDGHIYVNVEDKSQLVAFDSKSLKVLHTWPLAPCKEPSGLAIDVEHKRLFAGCHNQMMAMVDYTDGKVVATVPIGKGVSCARGR
jgi:DNA-binding beta-propeller fold protein YncE